MSEFLLNYSNSSIIKKTDTNSAGTERGYGYLLTFLCSKIKKCYIIIK